MKGVNLYNVFDENDELLGTLSTFKYFLKFVYSLKEQTGCEHLFEKFYKRFATQTYGNVGEEFSWSWYVGKSSTPPYVNHKGYYKLTLTQEYALAFNNWWITECLKH